MIFKEKKDKLSFFFVIPTLYFAHLADEFAKNVCPNFLG